MIWCNFDAEIQDGRHLPYWIVALSTTVLYAHDTSNEANFILQSHFLHDYIMWPHIMYRHY